MKRLCSAQGADRISYLPDPIQSHIVSFLPMKEAMRTAVLSKRWRHICNSLYNMTFDQFEFEREKPRRAFDFRDFVDDVIFRHNRSDVRRFSLSVTTRDSISTRFINACISFAVRHDVQELHVWDSSSKSKTLPLSFFTCNTLTKLELSFLKINWPAVTKFPMLRDCCFRHVIFRGKNKANKLFSSSTFPVLEELTLADSKLNVETLSISISSLKYLNIFEDNGTIVEVSGSTLTELDCDLCDPPDISSENLSSLSIAKFAFSYYFHSSDDLLDSPRCNYALKLLIGMHNVTTLSLSFGFLDFLAWDRDLLPCLPSLPRSPKHLSLLMVATHTHVGVVILLLRSYSHLETLHVEFDDLEYAKVPAEFANEELYQQVKELPLAEILSCLRTVTVESYRGGENELLILRYLLENAKLLEEISIITDRNILVNELITSKILSISPRASPGVKISVS